MIFSFEGFGLPLSSGQFAAHVSKWSATCFDFERSYLGMLTDGTFQFRASSTSQGGSDSQRGFVPPMAFFDMPSKLVVGGKISLYTNTNMHGAMAFLPALLEDYETSYYKREFNNPSMNPKSLPMFMVSIRQDTVAVRLQSYLNLTTAVASADDIFYREFKGVGDITVPHFYEAVYDTENDNIEIWIDNIHYANVPYTFTEEQKTGQRGIYLTGAGTLSGSTKVHAILHTFYVGDERLGPVQSIPVLPTADSEVSEDFGEGPYYPAVSDHVVTATSITATKSLSEALFTGQALDEMDIKAVSIHAALHSEHRSANETLADFKTSIKHNGVRFQGESVSIPEGDYVGAITQYENSPFTLQPWTSEELNEVAFGGQFIVTPRSP